MTAAMSSKTPRTAIKPRRPVTILDVGALPRSHVWYILDVMRKSSRGVQWAALLIDVDPDVDRPCDAGCSCWLDLGRHKSRDDAWDAALQMIATRH